MKVYSITVWDYLSTFVYVAILRVGALYACRWTEASHTQFTCTQINSNDAIEINKDVPIFEAHISYLRKITIPKAFAIRSEI